MPPLPDAIIVMLAPFAPLFSRRVWCHAQLLLLGAILAPGARTVTASLRVMGLAMEHRFTNYYRVRAAWIASWCACGRTLRRRGAACAKVHALRVGHARPRTASNRMRITGSPETSGPGRQWTLVWPWGQRACCASQSNTKACKS
jgi:hypothetical protein